ncbi:MAG: hypothetical protein C4K60_05190 [Ideonella sp. MAG2]|nr:MAG: hypothetical protein C4K60_05190 [Ideonella sp. MAG2]
MKRHATLLVGLLAVSLSALAHSPYQERGVSLEFAPGASILSEAEERKLQGLVRAVEENTFPRRNCAQHPEIFVLARGDGHSLPKPLREYLLSLRLAHVQRAFLVVGLFKQEVKTLVEEESRDTFEEWPSNVIQVMARLDVSCPSAKR